jgi:hypothetical protein
MMNIKEIKVNDRGKVVSAKGTFTKKNHKYNVTSIIYFWATLSLDYAGGYYG